MQASAASYVTRQLFELSLDDYKVNGGSIGCGPDGTAFAFTLGPVSDATVVALIAVTQKRGTISLICGHQSLFFDPVAVECKDLHRVRIMGRIVGGASDALRTQFVI